MTVLLGFLGLALGALGVFDLRGSTAREDDATGTQTLAALGAACLMAMAIVAVTIGAWLAAAVAAGVAAMLGTQLTQRDGSVSEPGVVVALPDPVTAPNESLQRAA
jgi:hypothetical protein